MKRYNLSEIMKSAHTMRKFRPEKYPTFSEALKKAWKVAKFNKETIAYYEAKKQEAQELAARAARIESERAERIAMEVEAAKREREERAAKVEAECLAYGYGRGEHYSSFSGWGNYCGD